MKALAFLATALVVGAWVAAIALGYAAIFGHDLTLGGAAFLSLAVAAFGTIGVFALWAITVIREDAS